MSLQLAETIIYEFFRPKNTFLDHNFHRFFCTPVRPRISFRIPVWQFSFKAVFFFIKVILHKNKIGFFDRNDYSVKAYTGFVYISNYFSSFFIKFKFNFLKIRFPTFRSYMILFLTFPIHLYRPKRHLSRDQGIVSQECKFCFS